MYSRTGNLGLCDGHNVKWVGARGNQTFVILDEMLIPESAISQYKAFANSEMIGKCCMWHACIVLCITVTVHVQHL